MPVPTVGRHLVTRLCLAATLASPMARLAAQQELAATVTVREMGTGRPIPYSEVTVAGGRRRLADANGTLVFSLPADAGPVTITARHIGFRPDSIVVAANGNRNTSLSLQPLAFQLQEIRVGGTACPGRTSSPGDTVAVRLLEAMRSNAENAQLLAAERPFTATTERRFAPGTAPTFQVDTVETVGGVESTEAVGVVSEPAQKDPADADGRIAIPLLGDISGEAFLRAHCFRYTGIAHLEDGDAFRLEFDPAVTSDVISVRGAAYLAVADFSLVRTMIFFDYVSDRRQARWRIQVESRFADVLRGLPAVASVCVYTTLLWANDLSRVATSQLAPPAEHPWIEEQLRLSVRFLNPQPGDVSLPVAPQRRCSHSRTERTAPSGSNR